MKQRNNNLFFISIFVIATFFSLISCVTEPSSSELNPEQPILTFLFTGDLMAHHTNFRQKTYEHQYAAIVPLLQKSDAAFTNLEFVIDNNRAYETYPRFNVQLPYVKTAIEAGFNVFSLANNHTIDWYESGVIATKQSVEKLKKSNHHLVFSGLKQANVETLKPEIFKIKGTKIAFLAVTELLNDTNSGKNHVNVVSYTKKGRESFTAAVAAIRRDYKPDLLILSIHVNEPEYVRTVTNTRKDYFRELATAGADIIWANHPHVPLPWENYETADGRQTVIMYSLGNLISGQRYTPNVANPVAPREYTGDAVVLSVAVTQQNATMPYTLTCTPHLFTTFVDETTGNISLCPFTADFIAGNTAEMKRYYEKRLQLLKAYLPLSVENVSP